MNKIELARLDQVRRGATLKVAASNATAKSKAAADYVFDGVEDNVEINAAITALATTGGCIELSEGTFNTISNIVLSSNVWLRGMGKVATIIQGTGTIMTVAIHVPRSTINAKISDLSAKKYTGIFVQGTSTTIFNCKCSENEGKGITDEGDRTKITLCDCTNNGEYGIVFGGSNGIATNNDLTGNVLGSYLDAASDTIIDNNILTGGA